MLTNLAGIDFVKTLRLKQVGLALATLWVIVLIAAVSSAIYREIDGPTISAMAAENVNLNWINSTLNENLDSAQSANHVAQDAIDKLSTKLQDSRLEYADLIWRFESYLSTTPVIKIQIGP